MPMNLEGCLLGLEPGLADVKPGSLDDQPVVSSGVGLFTIGVLNTYF